MKTAGRKRLLDETEEDLQNTLAELRKIGRLQPSREEVAVFLGVGRQTLFDFFRRCPEAIEALEEGNYTGHLSLRRKQFQQALDGNITMLIWLGKNLLGQTDKVENTLGATDTYMEFVKELKELDKTEPLVPGHSNNDDDLVIPGQTLTENIH